MTERISLLRGGSDFAVVGDGLSSIVSRKQQSTHHEDTSCLEFEVEGDLVLQAANFDAGDPHFVVVDLGNVRDQRMLQTKKVLVGERPQPDEEVVVDLAVELEDLGAAVEDIGSALARVVVDGELDWRLVGIVDECDAGRDVEDVVADPVLDDLREPGEVCAERGDKVGDVFHAVTLSVTMMLLMGGGSAENLHIYQKNRVVVGKMELVEGIEKIVKLTLARFWRLRAGVYDKRDLLLPPKTPMNPLECSSSIARQHITSSKRGGSLKEPRGSSRKYGCGEQVGLRKEIQRPRKSWLTGRRACKEHHTVQFYQSVAHESITPEP